MTDCVRMCVCVCGVNTHTHKSERENVREKERERDRDTKDCVKGKKSEGEINRQTLETAEKKRAERAGVREDDEEHHKNNQDPKT